MNNRKISIEDKRKVNRIYIVALIIIVIASLEAIMLAKSRELIKLYMELNPGNTVSDYVGIVLINFLINIMEPVLISIYTYFTVYRYGINKIFKIVFSAIVILRLVNIIIKFNFNSIFYYLLIIFYVIFLFCIINAPTKRTVKDGIR